MKTLEKIVVVGTKRFFFYSRMLGITVALTACYSLPSIESPGGPDQYGLPKIKIQDVSQKIQCELLYYSNTTDSLNSLGDDFPKFTYASFVSRVYGDQALNDKQCEEASTRYKQLGYLSKYHVVVSAQISLVSSDVLGATPGISVETGTGNFGANLGGQWQREIDRTENTSFSLDFGENYKDLHCDEQPEFAKKENPDSNTNGAPTTNFDLKKDFGKIEGNLGLLETIVDGLGAVEATSKTNLYSSSGPTILPVTAVLGDTDKTNTLVFQDSTMPCTSIPSSPPPSNAKTNGNTIANGSGISISGEFEVDIGKTNLILDPQGTGTGTAGSTTLFGDANISAHNFCVHDPNNPNLKCIPDLTLGRAVINWSGTILPPGMGGQVCTGSLLDLAPIDPNCKGTNLVGPGQFERIVRFSLSGPFGMYDYKSDLAKNFPAYKTLATCLSQELGSATISLIGQLYTEKNPKDNDHYDRLQIPDGILLVGGQSSSIPIELADTNPFKLCLPAPSTQCKAQDSADNGNPSSTASARECPCQPTESTLAASNVQPLLAGKLGSSSPSGQATGTSGAKPGGGGASAASSGGTSFGGVIDFIHTKGLSAGLGWTLWPSAAAAISNIGKSASSSTGSSTGSGSGSSSSSSSSTAANTVTGPSVVNPGGGAGSPSQLASWTSTKTDTLTITFVPSCRSYDPTADQTIAISPSNYWESLPYCDQTNSAQATSRAIGQQMNFNNSQLRH